MPDGASGWLPDSELIWSQGDRSLRESLVVGQEMQLQVVGYAHEYRRLLLSLRQAEEHAADGSVIEAQCPRATWHFELPLRRTVGKTAAESLAAASGVAEVPRAVDIPSAGAWRIRALPCTCGAPRPQCLLWRDALNIFAKDKEVTEKESIPHIAG
jgi:hypothetical protein